MPRKKFKDAPEPSFEEELMEEIEYKIEPEQPKRLAKVVLVLNDHRQALS